MKLGTHAVLAAMLLGAAGAPGHAQPARSPGAAAAKDAKLDVIVVMDPSLAVGGHAASQRQAARFARSFGVEPQVSYGTALFGFAATIPAGRLNALERHPRVLHVEVDRVMSVPNPGADGKLGGGTPLSQTIPWGVQRICGGICSDMAVGVDVCVLDTGIDSDHPDLAVGTSSAFETCRGKRCKTPWDDDNGHGTHVAGSIAAKNNGTGVVGIAPGASLHAVKVLNGSGSGRVSRIIAGIDWVAKEASSKPQRAVANMSLGGSGSKTGVCTKNGFTGADSYHLAICNAARKGVVFVVAAGNSGADAQNSVPAAYDDAVITASATQQTSGGKQDWPSWSNWGDGYAGSGGTLMAAPVAIAAPGGSILSTCYTGDTCIKSGTSMASPHVAGAAALSLARINRTGSYDDFVQVRTELLLKAESTANGSAFVNTSGRSHLEPFLNARPSPGS